MLSWTCTPYYIVTLRVNLAKFPPASFYTINCIKALLTFSTGTQICWSQIVQHLIYKSIYQCHRTTVTNGFLNFVLLLQIIFLIICIQSKEKCQVMLSYVSQNASWVEVTSFVLIWCILADQYAIYCGSLIYYYWFNENTFNSIKFIYLDGYRV